jgi:ribosome-binding protein aMBF1 (putative translation factor)
LRRKVKRHHYGAMRENLTQRVQEALKDAPCSMRSLADEAGVAHSILVRVQNGTRAATPDVAEKLAAVLEQWGARCTRAAKSLRVAARRVPTPRTRGN